MGKRGDDDNNEQAPSRSNVTIALSKEDKKAIEKLKKTLKKKSITQVFTHLLEFYEENEPRIKELENDRVLFHEKIDNLETKVDGFLSIVRQISEGLLELRKELIKVQVISSKNAEEIKYIKSLSMVDDTVKNKVTERYTELQQRLEDLEQRLETGQNALEELNELKSLLKNNQKF